MFPEFLCFNEEQYVAFSFLTFSGICYFYLRQTISDDFAQKTSKIKKDFNVFFVNKEKIFLTILTFNDKKINFLSVLEKIIFQIVTEIRYSLVIETVLFAQALIYFFQMKLKSLLLSHNTILSYIENEYITWIYTETLLAFISLEKFNSTYFLMNSSIEELALLKI
jgi:hypothetical protein